MDVWGEIWGIAEEQHGAFTTAQADAVGADSGWRQRARRDGRIGPLFRGAHAVLALIDELTPLAAAQLVQPRAVAGRSAAAYLHRFDGVDEWCSELLVPPGTKLRGMAAHRTSDLVVPEIDVVDGIRATDEVRTLVDWAAIVDDDTLERGMESVFRRDESKRALLVDRATALARPGRSGPARALRVEAKLPETRTESDLETVYWQDLRRYGVELPVRQHWVGRYRVDLAYPDIKLFIELDGFNDRRSFEAFTRDRHRQNDLVGEDWTPLRFTNADVRYYGRRTAMQTHAEVTRRRARLVALQRV